MQEFGNSGFRQNVHADIDRGRGGEHHGLPRRDLVQRVSQVKPARGLRGVADQDDVKPFGRGTVRSDRIGRALEPHRLVSQRRQHLLVSQQPSPFALDD